MNVNILLAFINPVRDIECFTGLSWAYNDGEECAQADGKR